MRQAHCRAGVAVLMVAGLLVGRAVAADGAAAKASPENPHVWQPRVRSVAVFKNGLGFFMRSGQVELRDGWCVGRQIPPATFGTLAVYSLDEKELVDVIGSGPGEIVDFDDTDAPSTLPAKRSRLEASRNLRVQLTYTHKGQTHTAAGRLVSVGPGFVVLEAQSNNYAAPLKGITRLQVLDLPIRVHVAGSGAKVPRKTKLGMAYLRKGITWIPEYTLKVIDEETAQLTLRGTLVNEAEDLIHCDVNFVVGVPHFAHTGYMAPVAVGQVIRTIGAAVAPPQFRSQIMSRAALANTVRANQFGQSTPVVNQPAAASAGNLHKALGNLPQMGGAAATDYTVYTKKNLTVRRGEKAIVTLFVKTVRYSHLYRWSPPQPMRHMMVLHNDTDSAWTTGPCLAVSERRPITEDMLKYTPKGGSCELPVTVSVNVAHRQTENEVSRKLKVHEPSYHFYVDLVVIEGRLEIRNFEKKTIDVVIVASVPGRPLIASDNGSLSTNPTKLKLTERAGTVGWHIRPKPGETKTLTYKYERYVPSH